MASFLVIWIHKIWAIWIRIQDKITKFISNHVLKVKKKKYFLNLYLNLRDKQFFLVSYLKNIISYKIIPKFCWLNSAFPFILYLWIWIHGPKWMQIQIHTTVYMYTVYYDSLSIHFFFDVLLLFSRKQFRTKIEKYISLLDSDSSPLDIPPSLILILEYLK